MSFSGIIILRKDKKIKGKIMKKIKYKKRILLISASLVVATSLVAVISCNAPSKPPTTPPVDPPTTQKLDIKINDIEKTNLSSSLRIYLANANSITNQQRIYSALASSSLPTEAEIILKKVFSFTQAKNEIIWANAVDKYTIIPSSTQLVAGQAIPSIQIQLKLKNANSANNLNTFDLEVGDLGSAKNQNINVSKKSNQPTTLSPTEFSKGFSGSLTEKIAFANLFFDGLNQSNINDINLNITTENNSQYWKVAISPKEGSSFTNGASKIESNQFTTPFSNEENFVETTQTGPTLSKDALEKYLQNNNEYSLDDNTFAILNSGQMFGDSTSTYFKFLKNFPRFDSEQWSIRFFRNGDKNGKQQFKVRIHPTTMTGNSSEILKLPCVQSKNNGDLLISVSGFLDPTSASSLVSSIYAKELDNIIEDINKNGVTVNAKGRSTVVKPSNADSYHLNEWIDFKKPKSDFNLNRNIVYNFSNISYNQQSGVIKAKITAFVRDNNLRINKENSLFESKESNLITFNVKPSPNFVQNYNQQTAQNRTKINTSKLNNLVSSATKNNKGNYFPHKISREQLVSIVDNYDTRPNNLFLDYVANADNGTLEVRLLERNFGNWDRTLSRYFNMDAEYFKSSTLSQYDPQITDRIVDSYKITGFKTWAQVTEQERGGHTTFKSWYAWRRSFTFNLGLVFPDGFSRYDWDATNQRYKRAVNTGKYAPRSEFDWGTAWIANKISDTEFVVATNSHVAELTKQFNNSSRKYVGTNSDNYTSVSWMYNENNWGFDYKDHISFSQIPFNTDHSGKSTILGVEIDPKTRKIIGEAPHPGFHKVMGKNYWPDGFGAIASWKDLESIKLKNVFSRKYSSSKDPATLVTPEQNAYYSTENPLNNQDEQKFGVGVDLAYFTVKYKDGLVNNEMNKIWEELGPTSFAPIDDLVFSNIGNSEQFANQKGQKTWNNFSTGGYPEWDKADNPPDGVGQGDKNKFFVYKGDGGKDQFNQNDYLDTRFDIHNPAQEQLNVLEIDFWQKQNEGSTGGSSGSPIFDKNMNIIGILWGGIVPGAWPNPAFHIMGVPLWTEIRVSAFRFADDVAKSIWDPFSERKLYKQLLVNYNAVPLLNKTK